MIGSADQWLTGRRFRLGFFPPLRRDLWLSIDLVDSSGSTVQVVGIVVDVIGGILVHCYKWLPKRSAHLIPKYIPKSGYVYQLTLGEKAHIRFWI